MKRSSDIQCENLLKALRAGPVTSLQALDRLGIARAAARVFDLRAQGFDVQKTMIVVKNRHGDDCRVAQYSLATTQMSLVPQFEKTMARAA